MKLTLVLATLVYLEGCLGSFWDQNQNGPRRPVQQRMGRDRPSRPMRYYRHIQSHNGFQRPPPPRMHRPPVPGRRNSRPPPPPLPFRHHGPPFPNHNQGSMLIQPMMHPIMEQHPPPRQELQPQPPPYFQQDEIIQEQSKHFPVTALATPNLRPPVNIPNFEGVPESKPHSYFSSKGWKPIVKPHPNSYLQGQVDASALQGKSIAKPAYGIQTKNTDNSPNWNLDTLFRENTEHMKSNTLKPAFSENQGVRVPPPTPPSENSLVKPIKAIELPVWNKRLSTAPVKSQSEEAPVVVKKPISRPKLTQKISNQSEHNNPSSTEESAEGPKFPKFKFRPRPQRPGTLNKEASQSSHSEQKSVLPSFPQKDSEEGTNNVPQDQQALNLKAKLTSRGRVRVRTKQKVEQPSPQSTEDTSSLPHPPKQFHRVTQHQSHQPGESSSSSAENFPGRRNPPSSGQNNAGPHRPTGSMELYSFEEIEEHRGEEPSYFGPPQDRNNREPENQGHGHHQPQNSNEQRPPHHPNRGHIRHHHRPDQRLPKPPPPFLERPAQEGYFSQGQPESTESVGNSHAEHQSQQQRRRKRPKDENKHKNADTQQPTSYPEDQQQPQQFAEEPFFPPGFHPDSSKSTEQHPVSFMTMPGSKPQVIHHTYNNQHPQQQQLYPINVMRSPPSPDFSRPVEIHGSNPNGNYVPNNRPRFGPINVQNGVGGQPHRHNKPPPPGFPNNQHNPGRGPPGFPPPPHNSNHDSPYFPVAYGSNHAPFTYGGPPPPLPPPPPPPNMRQHMTHPPMSPAAQNNVQQRIPPMSSSTTMRDPFFINSNPPPLPPHQSSTFSSAEFRDSSESSPFTVRSVPQQSSPSFPTTSTRPVSYPPPPPPHPHNPQRSNMSPPRENYAEYAPSYGSAEFDKIPMQFMEHLRPILREETTTSGSHSSHNSHHSADIYPPASFFDNFFQPFDQSFNPNPEQELDSKSTSEVANQVHPPQMNLAYDRYNGEQSSPQPLYVPRPDPTQASSTPVYSSSPFSHQPNFPEPTETTSSVRNNAFVEVSNSRAPVWSKLQENDNGVSSTELILSTSAPVQKKLHKVNQNKHYQSSGSTSSSTTAKTWSETPKSKIKDVFEEADHKTEKIPPVTTYKPVHPPRLEKFDEEGEESQKRLSDPSSPPHEDDMLDSNTPRSVRLHGRQTITSTTELPEENSSTIFKSRRHFRRRRPDASVRRRFFSSRVKPAAEEETNKSSTAKSPTLNRLTMAEEHNPIEENDDGYEPSRISSFKQRRIPLHQRRRNLGSHRLRGVDDTFSSTTPSQQPSSSESETVTYGESQWFRIKPTDSSELAQPHPVFKLRDHHVKKEAAAEQPTTNPMLLPFTEPSSEVQSSSTEAGVKVKTSYSSKHSVSFVEEGRKFPMHKKVVSAK